MPNYIGTWVSMACVVFLFLIQQIRNIYGFRSERGRLLLSVPVPGERKRLLFLHLLVIFLALICVAAGMASAWSRQRNAVYALLLVMLLLLTLALLWTAFSFAPTRLYENGLLDRFGFTAWSRLSYGGEQPEWFRLRLTAYDFSRDVRLRKDVFLFCAEAQRDRVREILKGRAEAESEELRD